MQTDKNDVLDLARRVCTVQYFPADLRGLHIVPFQVCQCGKAKVLEVPLTRWPGCSSCSGAKTSLGITQLVRGIF